MISNPNPGRMPAAPDHAKSRFATLTFEREVAAPLSVLWQVWTAPAARAVHPREEHLLPLMVIAGAAGDDRGRVAYAGTILGLALSAYHFG